LVKHKGVTFAAKMPKLTLLIGGNRGNRADMLRTALHEIEQKLGAIVSTSSVYETEPWGFDDAQKFLNQVVVVDCKQNIETALQLCLDIEKEMGRTREGAHYAGRTMDIDILFYDDCIINTRQLIVPHPRLHLRRFALVPLCEIDNKRVHPLLNETMQHLLDNCTDTLAVVLFQEKIG
jgi:2-amino-4-hydroxy-6-hydroxymethyldihydropteridine diphosphokinase